MTLARFAFAALCFVAAGCDRDALICDEKSPGVAYARSLSQDRLARLYQDMQSYSNKEETPINGWYVQDTRVAIPSAFADLAVVRIRPREGNIMVHGCFDHAVYLDFEFDQERRIVLLWGEHPEDMGEQVLWTENIRQ